MWLHNEQKSLVGWISRKCREQFMDLTPLPIGVGGLVPVLVLLVVVVLVVPVVCRILESAAATTSGDDTSGAGADTDTGW